ncbi:leucine-rich repeat-containing protein 15-like [Periplaneta americana]|uniref:leucine-rich repeat-containing protein 15-like n=1 Tax=Periplaneta americana TaxID=6978 RepID=UPI0037E95C19
MAWALLLLTLLTAPWRAACISCPAPCRCYIIAGADCSNASLTQLPQALDRDLSILKVNNNSLTSLSRFTFSKLGNRVFPHLVYLSFRLNHIRNIEPSTFEGTRNLKELNLNRNKLTQINPSVFRNLHKLEKLLLEKNGFFILEKGMFRELTSLSVLDISENLIVDIKFGAFKGLGSLKKLYLRSNKLIELDSDTFRDLGSLVELDLSNNLLVAIKKDTFRGLWSLEIMELMFNKIRHIEKESFIDLSNLNRLDLDDNLIGNLGGNVFKGLVNLDTLYLSDNLFQHLGSDAFLGLRNLTTLYLTSNKIRTIESSTFQQTPLLEFLFLTTNTHLIIPEDDPFIFSGSLYYLDLSECNLTYIPPNAFSGLPGLLTLELSNNDLQSLDREVLKPMTERLSQVIIQENPLKCDCHLKSTWLWCRDHEVSFSGKCNSQKGRVDVSWDSFHDLDCGEALETTRNLNPDEEIETFVPVTVRNVVVIDDDEDPRSIPEHTSEEPDDEPAKNNSKGISQGVLLSQHPITTPTFRITRRDSDKAWSVVLFLSITVCLLLLIIAGLLISLIFYRRHNRTIIYSVPQ